jgi:hypothetical protein
MNTKEKIKKLWEYICEMLFDDELQDALEEFEIDGNMASSEVLETLSEEEAFAFLAALADMLLHVGCDGDFMMWGDTLHYKLGFDKETIENLVC